MIIPVRCFSCGNVISKESEEFFERIKKENPKKVLDELKIKKPCCRRMLLSHINLVEDILKYKV